jgi:hypothetical protein
MPGLRRALFLLKHLCLLLFQLGSLQLELVLVSSEPFLLLAEHVECLFHHSALLLQVLELGLDRAPLSLDDRFNMLSGKLLEGAMSLRFFANRLLG